jgi:hypothetical protein
VKRPIASAVFVGIVLLAIGRSALGAPSPADAPAPATTPAVYRNVTGTFVRWEPVDDKRGYAYIRMTNHGTTTATAECSVHVRNSFGNFGFDSLVGEEIAPGATLTVKLPISVGDGSFLIDEGEVTDC